MAVFLLVFFLLLIIYGFLIGSYRRCWTRLPEYAGELQTLTVKVSVLIPLRNEAANIERLWQGLSGQDYSKQFLEFIFIDDHSTDDTPAMLEQLDHAGWSVKKLSLGEGITSKKRALEAGIAVAQGELIVTTDADCLHRPAWVTTIVSFYKAKNPVFIVAPVRMAGRNDLLNIFQTLDVLTLQGITGAAASKRMHALCNGANLAYPRSVFFEVGGFEGIDHIPSGDDMLLMQKIMAVYPDKVHYLKSKAAIVETESEKTWSDFFNQRIRWASKAVHYDNKKIFSVLLTVYLVNCCFLVLAIASLLNSYWVAFLLLFFIAKLIIEFPFVNSVAIFFGQQYLMKYFILMQPVHIIYTIVAGWLGRFGSYQWKSRLVKNLRGSAA